MGYFAINLFIYLYMHGFQSDFTGSMRGGGGGMCSFSLRPALIRYYGRENRQNTKARIQRRVRAVFFC
jgi:hypothetical protein